MKMKFFHIILMFLNCTSLYGIRFYLGHSHKKCLKEEIHKDVLVTGDHEIVGTEHQWLVDLTLFNQTTQLLVLHIRKIAADKMKNLVKDSKGHMLYSKEKAQKGKFAFTTEEYDVFEVCFEDKSPAGLEMIPERVVFLDLKHGVEAKSYEDLAKAEKLKPLEVELRRLEDLSKSIVDDFAYMRAREEEMRDTNESTHSRVMYFSIFSMTCLLCLAIWQVFYLRHYFKAKKLIE